MWRIDCLPEPSPDLVEAGQDGRRDHAPRCVPASAVDGLARLWTFTGRAVNSFPLQAWPDIVFFDALMRWDDGTGQVGYGETMDFFAVCDLTDEQAARGPGPW